jgi:hypothetical protein
MMKRLRPVIPDASASTHFLCFDPTPPGSVSVCSLCAKRELCAMMHEALRRMQMEFWKEKRRVKLTPRAFDETCMAGFS